MKKVYLVTMIDLSKEDLEVDVFNPDYEYKLIGIFSDSKYV